MICIEVYFANSVTIDLCIYSQPHRAIREILEGCVESATLKRRMLIHELYRPLERPCMVLQELINDKHFLKFWMVFRQV